MADANSEPEIIRMVCLANSRKLSGRCVAGKNPEGAWIRPISDREDAAVSEEERRYQDGKDVRLLDVVDVPVTAASPSAHQPENWLIDADWFWERVDRMSSVDLANIEDRPETLWALGWNTAVGANDRVPDAVPQESSLALIRAKDLVVRVVRPGEAFGNPKRRIRGAFAYRGIRYDFTITDPEIERRFLAGEDGVYPVGDRYVTVSLAEPYSGYAYKLIAAVFDE